MCDKSAEVESFAVVKQQTWWCPIGGFIYGIVRVWVTLEFNLTPWLGLGSGFHFCSSLSLSLSLFRYLWPPFFLRLMWCRWVILMCVSVLPLRHWKAATRHPFLPGSNTQPDPRNGDKSFPFSNEVSSCGPPASGKGQTGKSGFPPQQCVEFYDFGKLWLHKRTKQTYRPNQKKGIHSARLCHLAGLQIGWDAASERV